MFPIIDNIMIVDWIADDLSTNYLIPSLGSAIRVNFLKLKEDVNKDEVLSAVKGILENFKKISVGRNMKQEMEKRKQGKSEGNEKQKWVHDASVDYKGRVPIRASTGTWLRLLSLPFYRYRRLQGNPFMPILQVLIAAIRKRNLLCPSNPASMSENFQGRLLSHTSRLRFLDNAAIVEENNIEQKDSQWRSATVTRVEETKLILNVIPIWLTSLVVGVCTANHTVKQAAAMNLKINNSFKIPPASMESVSAFGTIICPNI
ncbi:hypothetical protein JHK85_032740 [Glycine max]|nr:hypothetical protein JHK85_032740 [Glycine max]